MPRISLSRLRPELTRWVEYVRRSSDEYVILTAHNREVAALVSMEALKLVWNAQDERRSGPIDPSTGRPFGREWVSSNFQGHYERHRDPDAHLRPSREDAPWLGRPFDWPPAAAPKQREPEASEERTPSPEARAPSKRWWQVWRR